eukprot:TRINITY_DN244318_c0_g1_i1.p1 TRINITY_DN244318_c0_g1~~TRINITY_DN244318_c0_g1_i1.p1  ORF type:complete len:710 (-),score=128.01 TRINITY_DN244318_c0_g1_i1:234-2363(-)
MSTNEDPPVFKWSSVPRKVISESELVISFSVIVNNSNCDSSKCFWRCLYNNQPINCENKDIVIKDSEDGKKEVEIVYGFQAYPDNSWSISYKWSRMIHFVETLIRDNSEEGFHVYNAELGDSFLLDELSMYPSMNDILDTPITSSQNIKIGFRLANSPKSNEVVLINCSGDGPAKMLVDTLKFETDPMLPRWTELASDGSKFNNLQPVPFSMSCIVTSSLGSDGYYSLAPDAILDGETKGVIWPMFGELLLSFMVNDEMKFVSSLLNDSNSSNSLRSANDVNSMEASVFSLTSFGGGTYLILKPQKDFFNENTAGKTTLVFDSNAKVFLDDLELKVICNDSNISQCKFPDETPMPSEFESGDMMVQLPKFDEICGSDNRFCNSNNRFKKIVIQNPTIPSDGSDAIGGAISCSPFCGGPDINGLGIEIVQHCDDYYNGPECSTYDYSQQHCGYSTDGSSTCSDCPESAICVGGATIRPIEGYWSPDEMTLPTKCKEPSIERCKGWDVETRQVICGNHFTGNMCESCELGYRPNLDGTKCKHEESSFMDDLKSYIITCAEVTGAALLVYVLFFIFCRRAPIPEQQIPMESHVPIDDLSFLNPLSTAAIDSNQVPAMNMISRPQMSLNSRTNTFHRQESGVLKKVKRTSIVTAPSSKSKAKRSSLVNQDSKMKKQTVANTNKTKQKSSLNANQNSFVVRSAQMASGTSRVFI